MTRTQSDYPWLLQPFLMSNGKPAIELPVRHVTDVILRSLRLIARLRNGEQVHTLYGSAHLVSASGQHIKQAIAANGDSLRVLDGLLACSHEELSEARYLIFVVEDSEMCGSDVTVYVLPENFAEMIREYEEGQEQ